MEDYKYAVEVKDLEFLLNYLGLSDKFELKADSKELVINSDAGHGYLTMALKRVK